MRSFICRRRKVIAMALFAFALGSVSLAAFGLGGRGPALVAAAPQSDTSNSGLGAYLNSARQLLSASGGGGESGRGAGSAEQALSFAQDPRAARMLRESIERTSGLIGEYQADGLANMPQLPNVPGLNSIMRLPDKLLRAELSMLQDGIRMAEEMRERPIIATVNTPRGKSCLNPDQSIGGPKRALQESTN